jgi:hypothetical protein
MISIDKSSILSDMRIIEESYEITKSHNTLSVNYKSSYCVGKLRTLRLFKYTCIGLK